MSYNNSSLKTLLMPNSRKMKQVSNRSRLEMLEKKLEPFKRMEMDGRFNRVLQGRNTVIPR